MRAIAALFVCLIGLAHADTTFFGCTLAPAVGVTSTGTGQVVCVNGQNDDTDALTCFYKVAGLTSNIVAAHWHVGTAGQTPAGGVTFTFGIPSPAAVGGEVDTFFYSTDGWTQRNSRSYDEQVIDCANTAPAVNVSGCYFNVHTVDNGGGELQCQGAPIEALEFTPSLNPNGNRPSSSGFAWLWAGVVPGSATRAWGYNLIFDVGTDVTASHIHKADAASPATGAVEVTFNIAGHENGVNPGGFVGVTLQGSARWATISSDFDSAFLHNFTYVNVHTTANTGGEVRGNFGITSSATTVSVSFAAVLVVLAKLFA